MKKLPRFANLKAHDMSCSEYADKLLRLSEDIDDYITWSDTPQGHEYWEEVSDNLKSLADKVKNYTDEQSCESIVVNGKKYKLVEVK